MKWLYQGFRYAYRCSYSARGLSSSTSLHASPPSDLILPSTGPLLTQGPKSTLLDHIRMKIMMRGGPLSLSEYMQDCLTSPHGGYYMHRDVFGAKGDFTTSPEISQLFGEMIGIWAVSSWMGMGSPRRLRLVELGPGRGTLMADLLRVVSAFTQFTSVIEVHLVELSPALREIQADTLKCSLPSDRLQAGLGSSKDGQVMESSLTSRGGRGGCSVQWHSTIDDVPSVSPVIGGDGDGDGPLVPSLYIAHEFFDALPAHQFVLDKERGWLEVMVDAADGGTGGGLRADGTGGGLRLVLSPSRTPASALLVPRRLRKFDAAETLSAIEISAKQMLTAETLAKRVAKEGGAALVIDYGNDQGALPYKDSLVALRDHKKVELLDRPGSADLSVWVDFGALKQAAEEGEEGGLVQCHGPVSQREFLESLGIHARLEQLIQRTSGAESDEAANLRAGVARVIGATSDGGMGTNYKAFSITKRESSVWSDLGLAN